MNPQSLIYTTCIAYTQSVSTGVEAEAAVGDNTTDMSMM
jgi:hypothetical protein